MDREELDAAYKRVTQEDVMNKLLAFVNIDEALWDAIYEIRDLRKQIRSLEAERDQWQRQAMTNG